MATGRKRKAADLDLEVEKLTFKDDSEFRAALKDVGIDAGPIDSSNRLACIVFISVRTVELHLSIEGNCNYSTLR